jgi:hypothetical protein
LTPFTALHLDASSKCFQSPRPARIRSCRVRRLDGPSRYFEIASLNAASHETFGLRTAIQRAASSADRAYTSKCRAQRNDIRMIESGSGPRFLQEALCTLSLVTMSVRSALIATKRFRRVSPALYTSPIPPEPSVERISYGPKPGTGRNAHRVFPDCTPAASYYWSRLHLESNTRPGFCRYPAYGGGHGHCRGA